jgi:hypothetical protein
MFAGSLFGDTIFFRPGGSTHGQVKKVEGGKLYIVTAPGSKPEEVDLSKIQRINFDPTYTNIGPAAAHGRLR